VLPSPKPDSIRLVPLGGLGEIGMNCLAIEQSDGLLVVDCGTSFPYEDLGIDVYHPDLTFLDERADRIVGVFVTHGHEDHIGGLPYLLDRFDVPVFGPPHALGLVRRRLEEHEFRPHEVDLRPVTAGTTTRIGPFEVESIRVAHSIVEASALAIRTAAGTVLHSGDFNFDPDPPDGEPTDEARLAALGDRGVDLLLCDSTNVDSAERQGSERSVAAALERLVAEAPGRVVIALFASNIQRLISLGDIARRTGRKLTLLGRSLNVQREVASEIGRLAWPSDLVLSPDRARELDRRELLVLAGGTQAEPNSAMSKLASGSHRDLTLDAGDTVIFSSRIIPGNERAVLNMQDELLRRGLVVHTRASIPEVHTSGHAGRSEQARMLELSRPKTFIPIHGTLGHLQRHAELATEMGVAQVLVVENGQTVLLSREQGLVRGERVTHGRVAVAPGGEPLPVDVLRKRAELGRSGIVTVVLLLDRDGELVGSPSVLSRGVPAVDGDDAALRGITREVAAAVQRARRIRGADVDEEARRAVRRKVADISGARPVVDVHRVRVG
jgi:ribonuclease J